MKIVGLLFCFGAFASSSWAQSMFGLDLEYIGACNQGGCTQIANAQSAQAKWVRIFLPWDQVEDNPPAPPAQPGVWGQMSGQHTYHFDSYIDGVVSYANSLGLNVYLQFYHPPSWANGNPYPNGVCDPTYACTACPDGQFHQGAVVSNTAYLQDLAYNVATHLRGQVLYYGVWNEPNLRCNFNPPAPEGNYLNNYITYIANPISSGIHAADSAAQVVGPDVSLTACGVPSGCAGGLASWVQPLWQYFPAEFNIFSVHTYHTSDHTLVRSDMDGVGSTTQYRIPVWLTETGYDYSGDGSSQSSNVEGTYIDNYNRASWWQRTFYHGLVGGKTDLLNPDFTPRPAFTTYRTIYPAYR